MKKVKYYYNKHSLRYEKIEVTFTKRLMKGLAFLTTSVLFAFIIVMIGYAYIDSPKEKQQQREIAKLQFELELAGEKLDQMSEVLAGLEDRDDGMYRTIFEAEPISKNIREGGYGGTNRYKDLEGYESSGLMIATSKKIDQIRKRLYIQSKSYDELSELIKNKEQMLASIPAIQPISNQELTRFASGYGYRMHPIYKVKKMHYGVDFTAPTGTPIYCTGDGKIVKTRKSSVGLGYHVVVDHGYGYETIYAHMLKIDVRRGQTVKRGDVLGYVGNTGTSTAPHLHYEVHKDGRKINPINFFYNDLSPEEYEKMIDISSKHNQSFD